MDKVIDFKTGEPVKRVDGDGPAGYYTGTWGDRWILVTVTGDPEHAFATLPAEWEPETLESERAKPGAVSQ